MNTPDSLLHGLIYIVGTLAGWVGLAALGVLIIRAVIGDRRLLTPALLAGVGLAVSRILTTLPSDKSVEGLKLPLVWPVMPWTAWIGALALAMIVHKAIGAARALNARESSDRLIAMTGWIAGLLAMIYLYQRDPDNKITILKGGIPLTFATAGQLALLAVVTLVLMTLIGRTTKGRGVAKSLAAQAALLVGSFVFGLPFAYLVITSFKEEQDMSSAKGIVWVPKVTETKPYFDKKNPLYEAVHDGRTVEGGVIARLPNNRVRVDIYRPLSIRGTTFETDASALKLIPKQAPVVEVKGPNGQKVRGLVAEDLDNGDKRVVFDDGSEKVYNPSQTEPVRNPGLRVANYTEAISFLPPETQSGLVYLRNSLFLVVMSVIGTVLSCAIVAYAFSRMNFPGKNALFTILLATMMLPGAVTLMPQFLIFRSLGWIDTLNPLWVPAFFAGAFNVFMLRQFFMQIPMELEDAAKVDGASYLRSFWSVMMPQIKPALAVVAVGTALGAWNSFQGPLIYINSPDKMPLAYALQLFQGDRGGEPGLLMAFTTLTILPPLALFFFAQRYIIEGTSLTGLGGR